jgi:hypothetical protein
VNGGCIGIIHLRIALSQLIELLPLNVTTLRGILDGRQLSLESIGFILMEDDECPRLIIVEAQDRELPRLPSAEVVRVVVVFLDTLDAHLLTVDEHRRVFHEPRLLGNKPFVLNEPCLRLRKNLAAYGAIVSRDRSITVRQDPCERGVILVLAGAERPYGAFDKRFRLRVTPMPCCPSKAG